jgi:valyl-tRNA synthetase
MPFITEEVWQRTPWTTDSIMVAEFPQANQRFEDPGATEEIRWVRDAVSAIRNIRGELSIPPSQTVQAIVVPNSPDGLDALERNRHLIEKLARVSDLRITLDRSPPKRAVTAVMGSLEVFLPIEETHFMEERRRLGKEIQKIERDLSVVRTKLSNNAFRTKAPRGVVRKEEEKQSALEDMKQRLEDGLRRLEELN